VISDAVRQTVEMLHSADGMFNQNTYFCELVIRLFLITRQLRKWILFRFSWLFMR